MSRDCKAFLHVDGHAMQWPKRFPTSLRLVGLLRSRERIFAKEISERIQIRIVSVNPRERLLSQFDRRDLLFADGRSGFQRRGEFKAWRLTGVRCLRRRTRTDACNLRSGNFRDGRKARGQTERQGSNKITAFHGRIVQFFDRYRQASLSASPQRSRHKPRRRRRAPAIHLRPSRAPSATRPAGLRARLAGTR